MTVSPLTLILDLGSLHFGQIGGAAATNGPRGAGSTLFSICSRCDDPIHRVGPPQNVEIGAAPAGPLKFESASWCVAQHPKAVVDVHHILANFRTAHMLETMLKAFEFCLLTKSSAVPNGPEWFSLLNRADNKKVGELRNALLRYALSSRSPLRDRKSVV